MALDSDQLAVRKALAKVAAEYERGSANQGSQVMLEEFTARAIVVSVIIWIDDVSRVKQAKSELNEAFSRELETAGVALA